MGGTERDGIGEIRNKVRVFRESKKDRIEVGMLRDIGLWKVETRCFVNSSVGDNEALHG